MTNWTPAAIVRLRLSIPPTRRELAARNPGRLYPPHLSLTEMAARLDVSRRTYVRWEAGDMAPRWHCHRSALDCQARNLRQRTAGSKEDK